MAVKILIADDEPDLEVLVRQRFRKQIRDKEYVFVFAGNGVEALDRFQSDPEIELVLTDINMPVMDGLTLLAKLVEHNPLIQPVIVSAYGDLHNIRTAMNRGAFDFLTKPIDFQDFETTLTKTLQQVRLLKEGEQNRVQLAMLQRELSVAHMIQQSMLPQDSPQVPGSAALDVSATMLPARNVGGDFYDYFLLDADRLGLVIGDVSGKGISAAMFMAMSRTALKAVALRRAPPGECLQEVNDFLCQENHTEMFVTVFYGVLNLRTGEFQYSNGGHNPPYLLTQGGAPAVLDVDAGGSVLGMFQGQLFTTGQTVLRPGDGLFLYTDGVTEAMDRGQQQFDLQRLSAFLQRSNTQSAADLVHGVVAAVHEFTAGATQSDDLTALVVRYLGRT
jgi:sigma-B regulation protein RsbU (phosphoserine phosphatase)